MSVEIKKCTIADLEAHPNFVELIAEYAAECSIDGLPEPRGKLDLYKSIERAGMMFPFEAKLDGILIGFMVVIVTVNPHYGIVLATTETLFVKRDRRYTGAGGRFIAEAKELAREHKSPGVFVIAPIDSTLEKVLRDRKDSVETNSVFFMKVDA